MTRIGQADQVLALVREQLERLSRGRGGRARGAATGQQATPSALDRLRMRDLDDQPPREVRRALVRALLINKLGEGFANEPAFQPILDHVFRIIEESEEGQALIERAMRQMAGPA